MTADVFKTLLDEQMGICINILAGKAKEYATEDRLHNFKAAAAMKSETPIQALAGMMAKHTISIYDMCGTGQDYPLALWREKITDHINYLLLLNALVKERENEKCVLGEAAAEERA